MKTVKIFKRFLTAVSVFAMFSGIILTAVSAESGFSGGLQASVSSDKPEYSSSEVAEVCVTVKNTNSFAVKNVTAEAILPDGLFTADGAQLSEAVAELSPQNDLVLKFKVTASADKSHAPDDSSYACLQIVGGGKNTVITVSAFLILSAAVVAVFTVRNKKCAVKMLAFFLCCTLLIPAVTHTRNGTVSEDRTKFSFNYSLSFDETPYELTVCIGYTKSDSNNEPQENRIYPVIIIPGMMGSELISEDGTYLYQSSDSQITDFSEMGKKYEQLKSDADGIPVNRAYPVSYSPMTEYRDGDTVGTQNAYKAVALALSDRIGFENVFFFGYDWRIDLAETQKLLAEYIDSALKETGAEKVNIVAHSMGSLLTSAYLAEHKSENKVNAIVTCGGPFCGVSSVGSFISGDFDLSGMFPDEYKQYAEILKFILPSSLTETPRSWTTIYEMAEVSAFSQLGFMDSDGNMLSDNAVIQKAWNYHCSVTLKLAEIYGNTAHLNLVGTGYDSDGGDGDGTVSVRSATANGAFDGTSKLLNLSHGALVSDPSALSLIADFVSPAQ